MGRRWLLGMLAAVGLTFGVATGASAQPLGGAPLSELGDGLDEPLEVDLEVATVTVTADTAEPSLEVEVAPELEVPEADTVVAPTVTAGVDPEGPSLEVAGPVEVAGTAVPVGDVVEEVAPPADEVSSPAPAPGGGTQAAGSSVSPAPAPAPAPRPAGPAPVAAPAAQPSRTATMSADRAAVRAGLTARTSSVAADTAEPAPVVAPAEEEPPLVAAAAPRTTSFTDLALPVIDPTPTVPGLLRLLAGLLVVGAAATWRTVRDELA